ncbi:MFS transporter [Pseudonocardia sp. TRM90224]|uniref:MFS transporter n=1 Tax=Pseudonocardia sp. TRM90224 TaxID=2812678 RepID=UPI001E5C4F5B|nr:MFS transporter [Pseudonocardia sp. TRM90224]
MRGGRDFEWLFRAYTVSTLGTFLASDAFALIAILALGASAAQVSLIGAVSGAVAAVLAVPLGPVVEHRRKRPVMVGADLVRFGALASLPVAYGFGVLTYPHLLAVAVVVALAGIVFTAAAGAFLKGLVAPEHLVAANGRFEGVMWVSTAVGPPLGTSLIGLFGPVVTVTLDAASYLLSASGLGAIRAVEPEPPARPETAGRLASIAGGWRVVAADPVLRLLMANVVVVNALIMAAAPLLAFLMLRELGFTPLEYGLSLGLPCIAGIVGARVARPLAGRVGTRTVLLVFGVARVVWIGGLAFVGPGPAGLVLVIALHALTIAAIGIYMPVLATVRLERVDGGSLVRVLTAWTITTRLGTAAATAVWGLLASAIGVRGAIGAAGALLLGSTLLLPWRRPA